MGCFNHHRDHLIFEVRFSLMSKVYLVFIFYDIIVDVYEIEFTADQLLNLSRQQFPEKLCHDFMTSVNTDLECGHFKLTQKGKIRREFI